MYLTVFVFFLDLGQVGDADFTRRTPGRPELNDIHLALLESNGIALDIGQSLQCRGLLSMFSCNK